MCCLILRKADTTIDSDDEAEEVGDRFKARKFKAILDTLPDEIQQTYRQATHRALKHFKQFKHLPKRLVITHVLWCFDQAGKAKDGSARRTQAALSDSYFERKKGKLVPTPDGAVFRELSGSLKSKFKINKVQGVFYSLTYVQFGEG